MVDLTNGDDFANGTVAGDVINGLDGDDTINGRAANDLLTGGNGDDELNGNSSEDTLFGGDGDDELNGGSGDDFIYGEAGDDVIAAGQGDDVVLGGDGDDEITGGAGQDRIFGGDGDDNLSGGAGNDLLDGGDGDNVLRGGAGNDTFRITGDGNNTINGFNPADDRIVVEVPGVDDFDDINWVQVDGNTVVGVLPNGGTILVNGAGPLTIDDLRNDDDSEYCFMAGTMIATPDGEKAIESLEVGDLVLAAGGGTVPVKWLAKQTVARVFEASDRARPVVVKAGALGVNVPKRDLILSRDHAILIDGVLVQAGALLNGMTVVEMAETPARFAYYNIECDAHELVIAEGAICETFVDNVQRDVFDNHADYVARYGTPAAIAELDLPRVKAPRQLPGSVRRIVADRAAALAPRLAVAA